MVDLIMNHSENQYPNRCPEGFKNCSCNPARRVKARNHLPQKTAKRAQFNPGRVLRTRKQKG
jgi:hypothetical protein